MGCSAVAISNEQKKRNFELIQEPFDYDLEIINLNKEGKQENVDIEYIQKINKLIINSASLISKYETIRKTLVNNLYHLTLKSGSFIFEDILPSNCLRIILYRKYIETNIYKSNFIFKEESPYMENELLQSDEQFIELTDYINTLKYLENSVDILEKEMHIFYYFIHEVPSDIGNYSSVIECNKIKVNKILMAIPMLKKCMNYYRFNFKNECFYFVNKKENYEQQLKIIKKEMQNCENMFDENDKDPLANRNEIFYKTLIKLKKKHPIEFEKVQLINNYNKTKSMIESKCSNQRNDNFFM